MRTEPTNFDLAFSPIWQQGHNPFQLQPLSLRPGSFSSSSAATLNGCAVCQFMPSKAQTPVSILSKLFVIDQAEKDQNNVVLRIANLGSPYVDVASVVSALSFILLQLWQVRWSASRISASP